MYANAAVSWKRASHLETSGKRQLQTFETKSRCCQMSGFFSQLTIFFQIFSKQYRSFQFS